MVTRSGTDVLSMLARDHDEWRGWIARMDEAGEVERTLLQRLRDEVRIHAQVADEIVYPAFAAMMDDEDAERLAEENRADHAFITRLLDEAIRVPRDSVSFGEAVLLARECIERHADEEEDKLFPRMARVCSVAMLDHLGHRAAHRRQVLRRQMRRARHEVMPREDGSVGPIARDRASARAGHGLSKTQLIDRLRRK